VAVLLADFEAMEAAGEAVRLVTAAGVLPAGMEIMDNFTINAVDDLFGSDEYPRDAAAVLLIELDGQEREVAAQALGVTLQTYDVREPAELDGAFTAMTKAGAEALLMEPDPFWEAHRQRVVDLVAQSRLPAVYPWREFVQAGGLMSYDVNRRDIVRRLGLYVDRIFKGAKPGDLPVEQPTKLDLLINLKTARALGLTIPQSLLMRADEVIQ
jgi:putative ABC transport system substrate-binding protein